MATCSAATNAGSAGQTGAATDTRGAVPADDASAGSVAQLAALRKTIPAELFMPSTVCSIGYVLWDAAVIAALYAGMFALGSASPTLWCVIGTDAPL